MNDYPELPERDQINGTTDLDTLMMWHEDAVEVFDSIKAQLSTFKITGPLNDEDALWAIRARTKANFAGATVRRVERQIVALGGPLPLTVDREERERLGKLGHRVRVLEHLLEKHGISENME